MAGLRSRSFEDVRHLRLYTAQRPGVVCLISLFRTCHCPFPDPMAHTASSGDRYGHRYRFRAPPDGQPVAFLLFGPSIVGHHRNILLTGDYLLWPLFAYCGIVTFDNLCRFLDAALSRSAFVRHRPVVFIGRNTFTLLVTHAFVYFPVMRLSTLTPWQTVGIIFAGYLLILIPLLLLKSRKDKQ